MTKIIIKKIIALCTSLIILVSAVILCTPAKGITYGKGIGLNAKIQSDEDLVELMNSAALIMEYIKASPMKKSVNSSDSSNLLQSGITYENMTIYQEFSTDMVVFVQDTSGNKSKMKILISGDVSYYITTDAIMIQADEYIEQGNDIIHLIANYYIDENNVFLMIEKFDSSDADSLSMDHIMNKWISCRGGELDDIASMLQQLSIDTLPNTLRYMSNYFGEKKDDAFIKEDDVYSIKNDYFKDFYVGYAKISSGAYSSMGTTVPDDISGNYIFDLSNKRSPEFEEEYSASYAGEPITGYSRITFKNIDNTVLKAPKKIYNYSDLTGGIQ